MSPGVAVVINVFLLPVFSSHVRRREVESERKRNLANKVDEIKKKMKNSEKNEKDSSNSTMIGLAICVAVVGFAYFYYYFL